MTKPLTEDLADRYKQIIELTRPADPALSSEALQPVIAAAAGRPENELAAVCSHVAEHSKLTVAQAKPVVEAALEGGVDPKAKAAAVSSAVAETTSGLSAGVELSDPVMLAPWVRVSFAWSLFGALLACVACIALLGDASGTNGTALVSLAVLGVLALVGLLVLVMGYKNVTIKGTGPGGGGKG